MAKYNISTENFLGMSHYGGVTAEGEGTVELSDAEVAELVGLIRHNGTENVKEMHLEEECPEIYEKLLEAHKKAAFEAEMMHWLWEGYECNYYEYDQDELISYCEAECGFSFDEDPEDYEDSKQEFFYEWLDDYLHSLNDEELKDFFCNHMNADVDMSDWTGDFEVTIPDAIIQMAK